MIVIKLGGSLTTSGKLQPCLDKIDEDYQGRAVVIVPGGGELADQVRKMQRQWQFGDRFAHRMAILAMQQMALLFKALKPCFTMAESIPELRVRTAQPGVSIWSPNVLELDKANISSTWDMTSDSLAAWLAKTLTADELILVKSVTIDADWDVLKLVQNQIVDVSFPEYIQQANFSLNIVNAEKFIS
ncbi:aspartate/glutamate/uridylate kinase [Methyloglobulus morosus KoM1]|uniref:Aspartate/glutamate/uridylate kinase n=1 Tax=Methyloglobulus morosus KoM1 TaxID=1116472 RepID=V5C793_9GAMM|nr:aspartate/glutamate/uridylate kinase [Methyloglobulus morosus]ESS72603.1 aspartate/glutamate/uridylate kinase [Methyloglobulus morosus KoM1]